MVELVDLGTYDVSTSMAIDERLLEASRDVLRVYELEKPSFVMAWRTDFDDLDLNKGVDYSRRKSDGSTIPCQSGSLPFSITLSSGYNSFPDSVFEDEVGPKLAELIKDFSGLEHQQVDVDSRHYAVRLGDYDTPDGVPSGLPILSCSGRKSGEKVQFQGLIQVEPWDLSFIQANMHLPEDQVAVVDSLPYMNDFDVGVDQVKERMIEEFAGENYDFVEPSYNIESLLQTYNGDWVEDPGIVTESGDGHCFLNRENGRVY